MISCEKLLAGVTKPARYTGGELNAVRKDPSEVAARVAMCFPDVYEVGMSHLGLRILYHLMNARADTYCERAFAPWVDMEEGLRREGIPLCTLETDTPLSQMDIVAFTLPYELSYSNLLNMLDLGGVAVESASRGEGAPFVLCGGACAFNPEPLAPFVDLFAIGDGEEVTGEIIEAYIEWKESGAPRAEFLRRAAKIEGVYVPALYEVRDGAAVPTDDSAPARVVRRVLRSLDTAFFPHTEIVPFHEAVHDRITLEVFRGCTRGCRFCQAGYIYRPIRERGVDTLLRQSDALCACTGYEEMSLLSLSTGDYSKLPELVRELVRRTKEERVSLSLPSQRLDSFDPETARALAEVRRTGLTFAPEAGTQRLRDVINKNITEKDILDGCASAFEQGWSSVKLYFMIGLPTETEEDLDGIVDLAHKIRALYPRDKARKKLSITISTSSFVPKPCTPFQWEAQDDMETLFTKRKYLQGKLRGFSYNWHEPKLSMLEAAFARGGREMADVLLRAWRLGCRFDGWADQFKDAAWFQAAEEAGVDLQHVAARARAVGEPLPWGHLDAMVTEQYLAKERERAFAAVCTPDCRNGCNGCGMQRLEGGCPMCE